MGGLPGAPNSGYASGARTPVPHSSYGGFAPGTGALGAPGASGGKLGDLRPPMPHGDPVSFHRMETLDEWRTRDFDRRNQGASPSDAGASSVGWFSREFESYNFPEQDNLVVMPDDEDDDPLAHFRANDRAPGHHQGNQPPHDSKRIHDEMDALLNGTCQSQMSAEQQLSLRQMELRNRAQMAAVRAPQATPSIDRVMQRDIPGAPISGPPQGKEEPDNFFGIRCFRACS